MYSVAELSFEVFLKQSTEEQNGDTRRAEYPKKREPHSCVSGRHESSRREAGEYVIDSHATDRQTDRQRKRETERRYTSFCPTEYRWLTKQVYTERACQLNRKQPITVTLSVEMRREREREREREIERERERRTDRQTDRGRDREI